MELVCIGIGQLECGSAEHICLTDLNGRKLHSVTKISGNRVQRFG